MKAIYDKNIVYILDSKQEGFKNPIVTGSLFVTDQLESLLITLNISEILDKKKCTVLKISEFIAIIPELLREAYTKKIAKYSASLKKNNNHYDIAFRHPLILQDAAKYGKKIHKGLGSDKEYAELICRELNALLKMPELWKLGRLNSLQEKTLDCFFGPLESLGENEVD